MWIRCAVVAALALLTAGCAEGPAVPDNPTGRYLAAVRPALPGWSDPELTALGSIACSAPGAPSDAVTSLRATRDALDYRQASVVVAQARAQLCPGG